ncbi:unnamed protein product [Anisakis simplex]|uniref:Uncharacterized protein n=1 Tax=Anisakis simplex TaxID=6269 RepID=A0A0M3JUX9_ANISI|nr:unnamed protein product [Anisakis simplex]
MSSLVEDHYERSETLERYKKYYRYSSKILNEFSPVQQQNQHSVQLPMSDIIASDSYITPTHHPTNDYSQLNTLKRMSTERCYTTSDTNNSSFQQPVPEQSNFSSNLLNNNSNGNSDEKLQLTIAKPIATYINNAKESIKSAYQNQIVPEVSSNVAINTKTSPSRFSAFSPTSFSGRMHDRKSGFGISSFNKELDRNELSFEGGSNSKSALLKQRSKENEPVTKPSPYINSSAIVPTRINDSENKRNFSYGSDELSLSTNLFKFLELIN